MAKRSPWRRSTATPVSVIVSTVVVRSNTLRSRTAAFWAPMARASSAAMQSRVAAPRCGWAIAAATSATRTSTSSPPAIAPVEPAPVRPEPLDDGAAGGSADEESCECRQ